mgnify:CR=1 FL=1
MTGIIALVLLGLGTFLFWFGYEVTSGKHKADPDDHFFPLVGRNIDYVIGLAGIPMGIAMLFWLLRFGLKSGSSIMWLQPLCYLVWLEPTCRQTNTDLPGTVKNRPQNLKARSPAGPEKSAKNSLFVLEYLNYEKTFKKNCRLSTR